MIKADLPRRRPGAVGGSSERQPGVKQKHKLCSYFVLFWSSLPGRRKVRAVPAIHAVCTVPKRIQSKGRKAALNSTDGSAATDDRATIGAAIARQGKLATQSRVEINFIGRKVDEEEEKEPDTSRFSATNGLSEFEQTFGPLITGS